MSDLDKFQKPSTQPVSFHRLEQNRASGARCDQIQHHRTSKKKTQMQNTSSYSSSFLKFLIATSFQRLLRGRVRHATARDKDFCPAAVCVICLFPPSDVNELLC